MPSGALQPEWHGSGRGGWNGLGERCIYEAWGVCFPWRLSSHLWLRLLCDSGVCVSMGTRSVCSQHRGFPALLLLLLEPSREQADCSLVPVFQLGELFKSVQGDKVLYKECSPNQKSEGSCVPHFPLTATANMVA